MLKSKWRCPQEARVQIANLLYGGSNPLTASIEDKLKKCFCVRKDSDLLSVCIAKSNEEQKECMFYEKASREKRCMYYVLDNYCDSLDAQLYAIELEKRKQSENKTSNSD
jgi:hypothetical protein